MAIEHVYAVQHGRGSFGEPLAMAILAVAALLEERKYPEVRSTYDAMERLFCASSFHQQLCMKAVRREADWRHGAVRGSLSRFSAAAP